MNRRPTDAATLHTPSLASQLPQDWDWYRLDEVCEGVFDCPHSTPVLAAEGPYLARSQDIRSGVFRAEEAARVSGETYLDRVRRAEPMYGDLLYSREGTYFGIAAEVPQNIQVCLGQRMVLIRPEPSAVDFRYLRYWLNSPVLTGHIYGHRDGTVAERLNLPTIRGLPVPVAPLDDQKAIGRLLGSMDDKIDLNRRTNETLEEIARALFRSWFVDFDPVRAKQAGRQPSGLDAATAGLFPDSFEDSPLGPIPAGWLVRTWGELVVLAYGKSLRGYEENQGPYVVFGTNGPIGRHDEALCQHPGIVIGRKGAYRGVHYHDAPFFVIDTAFYVEPKVPIELRWAYYQMLGEDINGMDSGSAIPSTSRDEFCKLLVPQPPLPIQQRFVDILASVWKRQTANDKESQTLAALLDALLPKLLSGEIRVSAAKNLAESES